MVNKINITHVKLSLSYRNDRYVTNYINLRKANLKPMKTKLIKFGKKIGKWSLKDNKFKGLKYYKNSTGNYYYKYQSPYQTQYNLHGETADEIVIYARPNTVTSYIFYDKKQSKLYYGITDASFTFHPEDVIHIYSEELISLEDAPTEASLIFIPDNKVNELRYAINHEDIPPNVLREQFPIPAIIVSFPNYIFSRSLNMLEVENENKHLYGSWIFRIGFPFTGIRKKTAIREWTVYKSGIPKPSVNNNPHVVHRVMHDGYWSDEEPLSVKRDRLKREEAIERAIESMRYTKEELTLADIPEPDDHGYITFNKPMEDNYDMNFPEKLFTNYIPNDNGDVLYYYINGHRNFFNPNPSLDKKLETGQYGFYWCPTDDTFGIRCKKPNKSSLRIGASDNKENEEPNQRTNTDKETAHMVNKYIYLNILNENNQMVPQVVDFYTRSNYYLGRLRYEDVDIRRKKQISISVNELKASWDERPSTSNNN